MTELFLFLLYKIPTSYYNRYMIQRERKGILMGKRKKRKKRKEKKSFKLNIVSLLFCTVAFYMIFTIIGQRRSLSDINDKKDAKLLEKAETEIELQEFREDYEKINDPEQFLEIVEKIARDEYKMVKPYETVYIDKNKTKNKFIMGIGTE